MQVGVQGRLCLKAFSAPGEPGPTTKAARALLLPCLLRSIWKSNRSSRSHLGGRLCCTQSSLQPLTLAPRFSRSPARWEMDPACWHLGPHSCCSTRRAITADLAPRHTGTEHGELGEGGSSLSLMGALGVTASSVPPPGSTVILQNTADLFQQETISGL